MGYKFLMQEISCIQHKAKPAGFMIRKVRQACEREKVGRRKWGQGRMTSLTFLDATCKQYAFCFCFSLSYLIIWFTITIRFYLLCLRLKFLSSNRTRKETRKKITLLNWFLKIIYNFIGQTSKKSLWFLYLFSSFFLMI